jgi:YD repeat-containing protein
VPATGVKLQTEPDYRHPKGLALTRHYHSFRFHDPKAPAADARTENRFGATWRSNFDTRIIPISGSTFVSAALSGPNGDVQYFDAAGAEIYNYRGAKSQLVAVPGTGWFYRGPEDTEFYGTDGRLRSIASRTGQLLTLDYSDGTAAGPNGAFAVDADGNPTATVLRAGVLIRVADSYGNTLAFANNAAGLAVKITDPAGGQYLYAYDTDINLTSVTYPDGKVRAYRYNEPANMVGGAFLPFALTSVVDENLGVFATFKYDTSGRAVSTEHAGGVDLNSLAYDGNGANVTDSRGTLRSLGFANVDGLTRYTGASLGGASGYTNGIKNRTYDDVGNAASQTDFNKVKTCYAYDTARNLETVRVEGLPEATTCDSVTAPGAGLPAGSRKVVTEWHARWRTPVRVSEPGRRTTFAYNGDSTPSGLASCAPASAVIADGSPAGQPIGVLCTKTLQGTGDLDSGSQGFAAAAVGAPRAWSYTYDAHGNVLAVNGPRTDVADVTNYTYYQDGDAEPAKRGNVATITNAAGHTTSITAYNAHGQPLTIIDANGLATALAYDPRQRLISRAVGGETTSHEYDAVGQLIRVTLPDNSFLTYSYDAAHRLIGMQDNLGDRIAYTLDAMGNRTQEQVFDPASALAQTRSRVYSSLNYLFRDLGATAQTTEYTYDDQGNVVQVKDPLNRITVNAYDALNRLTKVITYPIGSAPKQMTYHTTLTTGPNDLTGPSLDCPAVGAMFAKAFNDNPDFTVGGVYLFAYRPNTCSAPSFACSVGSTVSFRLSCIQNCNFIFDQSHTVSISSIAGSCDEVPPGGTLTQYTYNGLDGLTQVTDPRNLATSYTLDGLGNLSQQVSPDTGTTTNTYDSAGNLLTQTDAKNQTTTYAYDALNRVTQITFHDGSKQVYAYDVGANGFGRLASITERSASDQVTSVIAYAYEPHGRVVSETRTVSGVQSVLGYIYDTAGRLSGLTYPSGRTVTYGFDALGRVNQVMTVKGSQSAVAVQNVAYHPFGGVKGFTLGNGQSYTRGYDQDGRVASYTLGASQYAIGYDDASRITFISDIGNPANSNTYGYDTLDRLTSAVLPSTPFAYSYDAVGNRISKTVGSATESYAYSASSNRLDTLTPTTGPTRNFGFDANGSTLNDGLNSYVYDTRGRMVQATSVVGATNYQVNALGQRIRKTNSSTDTLFHYDTKGKLIAESDPGGGVYKREFIYLGDLPVMVFQ